jgi:hypothetical protein
MPVIPRPENLIPQSERTPEEAREMGRKGGIASGEARREKKRMSQIYAEFLEERFKVAIDGEEQETTGEGLVNIVVKKVLSRGGGPSVALMKELREATEGTKLKIGGLNGDAVPFEFVAPPKADESTPEA